MSTVLIHSAPTKCLLVRLMPLLHGQKDGVKAPPFLERVWKLKDMVTDEEGYSADLETKMHRTIKKSK